jgi:hypothetical protein
MTIFAYLLGQMPFTANCVYSRNNLAFSNLNIQIDIGSGLFSWPGGNRHDATVLAERQSVSSRGAIVAA